MEVDGLDVNEQVWKYFMKRYRIKNIKYIAGLDHAYIEGIRWAADSKAFIYILWGHSDEDNYLNEWFGVYDVKHLKPSSDINIMNRNSVHIKK